MQIAVFRSYSSHKFQTVIEVEYIRTHITYQSEGVNDKLISNFIWNVHKTMNIESGHSDWKCTQPWELFKKRDKQATNQPKRKVGYRMR